jgi:ADP-ribosylglycohydrolase
MPKADVPPNPPRPYSNSYWVEPGRVLAGEYPGAATGTETRTRLEQLIACGVTSFIDLTREGELDAYEPLLTLLTGNSCEHQRFAIPDHSIPDRPQVVIAALDAIDAARRRGRCVYVHCRAGIGRTGMIVAAYLMRQGLDNMQAFNRLQDLWQECGRARRWPVVPETDEQIEYVYRWQEPARRGPTDRRSRSAGALMGLVLADSIASTAKGAVLDPAAALASPNVLPADSAQTVAVLESLLARGEHDPFDQLQRYVAWSKAAPLSVPDGLKRVLATAQWSRKKYCGSHDPSNLDPHSVSRCLAVAMCFADAGEQALEIAVDVSRTTQQSPVVLDVCRTFTAFALDALEGTERTSLASGRGAHVAALSRRPMRPEVTAVIERRASHPKRELSAPAVLDAALQALASTDSFASGIQSLLQNSVPTAAALFGALAGACFGVDGLPAAWRGSLPQQPTLTQLIKALPA